MKYVKRAYGLLELLQRKIRKLYSPKSSELMITGACFLHVPFLVRVLLLLRASLAAGAGVDLVVPAAVVVVVAAQRAVALPGLVVTETPPGGSHWPGCWSLMPLWRYANRGVPRLTRGLRVGKPGWPIPRANWDSHLASRSQIAPHDDPVR